MTCEGQTLLLHIVTVPIFFVKLPFLKIINVKVEVFDLKNEPSPLQTNLSIKLEHMRGDHGHTVINSSIIYTRGVSLE